MLEVYNIFKRDCSRNFIDRKPSEAEGGVGEIFMLNLMRTVNTERLIKCEFSNLSAVTIPIRNISPMRGLDTIFSGSVGGKKEMWKTLKWKRI
jgi:hypothetical protein